MTDLLGRARHLGVLDAADVHVARALTRLAGDDRAWVAMAAALATRAPRFGHVAADLADLPASLVGELDPLDDDADSDARWAEVVALGWPSTSEWVELLGSSPLVTGASPVLVLDGSLTMLERFATAEVRVADALRRLAATRPATSPLDDLGEDVDLDDLLARLLPDDHSGRQRDAVRRAAAQSLTVLTGGPGTGKTTTVAALLAVLISAGADLRIALAAPTGKAAARLGEAFRAAAGRLPDDLAAVLGGATATTVHRLLGMARYDGRTQVRHDAARPLPFDVVIVDEMSMVSLPLMERLLAAVAPPTRLVLVGDPGQLVSVEAGAVLGALVGPFAEALDDAAVDHLGSEWSTAPLGTAVSVLCTSHRFTSTSGLGRVAAAVRRGDVPAVEAVLDHLAAQPPDEAAIDWVVPEQAGGDGTVVVRDAVLPAAVEVFRAAADGDAIAAVTGLERARLLCAHRLGRAGVASWNARVERWLVESPDTGLRAARGWYPGRPVLVTANDYGLGRFNGDLGVVVIDGGRTVVAFPAAGADGGATVECVPVSRLGPVETVHAMTIHKSQGSEFDHVVVILPPVGSRLASRELLYTGITRARRRVTLVGGRDALTEAVAHRVERRSRLARHLWGDGLRGPVPPR